MDWLYFFVSPNNKQSRTCTQLGPDGNIYVGNRDYGFLDVIENPGDPDKLIYKEAEMFYLKGQIVCKVCLHFTALTFIIHPLISVIPRIVVQITTHSKQKIHLMLPLTFGILRILPLGKSTKSMGKR